MYELHSIEQGRQCSSQGRVPLVHHGVKFYFRCGEDFYKMRFDNVNIKSAGLRCRRVFKGKACRFVMNLGHSFESVRMSPKSHSRRFADKVTKDQLLNIANYQIENVKADDQNHRLLCKITEKDIVDDRSRKLNKNVSSHEAKTSELRRTSKTKSSQNSLTSSMTSAKMEPIPPMLQFLLDQPEVAVDITDSSTEFEFTAEEILSGGEQATMIILPNPALKHFI